MPDTGWPWLSEHGDSAGSVLSLSPRATGSNTASTPGSHHYRKCLPAYRCITAAALVPGQPANRVESLNKREYSHAVNPQSDNMSGGKNTPLSLLYEKQLAT